MKTALYNTAKYVKSRPFTEGSAFCLFAAAQKNRLRPQMSKNQSSVIELIQGVYTKNASSE